MANMARKLGNNIYVMLQNRGISQEKFAERMGYTYRDACRIIEGRLLLTPSDLTGIADLLGVSKGELMDYDAEHLVPELQFMKEFSNPENTDFVLDLIDEYVELRESV